MDKQEIANLLVNKENFNIYINICLNENISIDNYDYLPDIIIYYDDSDYYLKKTGNFKDMSSDYIRINITNKITKFEINGKLLTGIKNFFKNYNKITKFVIVKENLKKIFYVKPNIINKHHWYINKENSEISYSCHSISKPAIIQIDKNKIINKKYYINGVRINKETFIKKSRKQKLSKIINV